LSLCNNCINHPDKWEVSVFMLDIATCKAGHYVSQTDAAPVNHFFDKQGRLITTCKDHQKDK